MAHFAEIDKDGTVLRVIVVADEHEANGEAWCQKLLGGTWRQTSFNGRIRKNFAGPGYKFDKDRDAFIEPRPADAIELDEATAKWKVPDRPLPDKAPKAGKTKAG